MIVYYCRNILQKLSFIFQIKMFYSDKCSSCLSQGIFVVGGMKDYISYVGNHTEIVDPFSSKPNCKNFNLPDLPSKEGRYGMVGTYLGNGSTIFCGGTDVSTELVSKECIRLILVNI